MYLEIVKILKTFNDITAVFFFISNNDQMVPGMVQILNPTLMVNRKVTLTVML